MYYVAQNDLYNAMNKPLTKSSGMKLEKCQDICIVKIQASLEENMYPHWKETSVLEHADRKQLYKRELPYKRKQVFIHYFTDDTHREAVQLESIGMED